MVKIEFSVVLYRGEPQLPDVFYLIKKYFLLAKVIPFLNLENTGNNIMCTDFDCDFPKMTNFGISKPVFSKFLSNHLET